jgi:purine-binding chemotaxis protein CheW
MYDKGSSLMVRGMTAMDANEHRNSFVASIKDEEPIKKEDLYLTFLLGGGFFAISIIYVREVIDYTDLDEVANMPKFMRGVIGLNGGMVPVIDLSVRCFDMQPTVVTPKSCIVILEIENEGRQQLVGVLVDAVDEVHEIPAQDIDQAANPDISASFISGMGKVQDRFVIILKVDNILSSAEIAVLGKTSEASIPVMHP